MAERRAKEVERGRKLSGRKPSVPEPGPRPKDQANFTDEDSRIMPKSGGGFIQGYLIITDLGGTLNIVVERLRPKGFATNCHGIEIDSIVRLDSASH